PVAVSPPDRGVERLAEPGRALRHRVEDRLDVGGGARDDPKDVAGRGLLLQGLGEVAVTDLQLVEKPDVLDRDDRLGREGLEQGDLLVRERGWLPSMDGDRADGAAAP